MQRYVSKELIHFVGRNEKSEDSCYDLFKKILKCGWLTFPPHDQLISNTCFRVNVNKPFEEMLTGDYICFCDIPIADLAIHMGKYSRFGISFKKPFLLEKGANPVFYYIQNNLEPGSGLRTSRGYKLRNEILSMGEILNTHYSNDGAVFEDSIKDSIGNKIGTDPDVTFERWYHQLFCEIFSLIKPVDGNLEDFDKNNYYMEREWRILCNVDFALCDVCRVVIPESYAKRFYKDFSESYHGQITFADETK
jgi:hypothetical protein